MTKTLIIPDIHGKPRSVQVNHLIHLLTATQLQHLQWAADHGYHCWMELGLKFHNGNASAYLQDVLCKKGH